MFIRRAEEKDAGAVTRLLEQVLEHHAAIRPDIFIPGTTKYTREQLAAILYRYARYKGYDVSGRANLTGYTDSGEIGSYAKPAMAWAVSSGLIHGLADARLAPRGIVTRAEAAVILMRFCESAAD